LQSKTGKRGWRDFHREGFTTRDQPLRSLQPTAQRSGKRPLRRYQSTDRSVLVAVCDAGSGNRQSDHAWSGNRRPDLATGYGARVARLAQIGEVIGVDGLAGKKEFMPAFRGEVN
jgi:hypothetical protein